MSVMQRFSALHLQRSEDAGINWDWPRSLYFSSKRERYAWITLKIRDHPTKNFKINIILTFSNFHLKSYDLSELFHLKSSKVNIRSYLR